MSIHDPIHMERQPGQQRPTGSEGGNEASRGRKVESPDGDRGEKINVSSRERLASVAGGVALALWGVRRRTLPGLALAALGGALVNRGVSGHCNMYQTLGIDSTRDHAEAEDYFTRGIHVEQSMTINKSPEELYAFWRNFENLPRIMYYLESVKMIDQGRSHWVAKAPAGYSVEWDAEIINDEPNQTIAWRSLKGAQVDSAGSVRFVPTPNRGTEVKVVLDYIPPGGRFGAAVAYAFGRSPGAEIREDLRCFKQLMEAGEIPTTEGQPRGSCVG